MEKLSDYDRGMNDAWKLAGKISMHKSDGGISVDDLSKIFGEYSMFDIFSKQTAQQAKSKIKAWEKSKAEIKVGDVVYLENPNKTYVVTYDENGWCGLLTSGGTVATALKESLTKTGRTIDVAGILEQIGGTT